MNVTTESKSEFLTVIRERRAVKRYDAHYRMNDDTIRELIRGASLAPSAWNLQHWKFIVVTDPARKEALSGIAYGQRQIIEASITVVILGDLQADRKAEQVFGGDVLAGRMTPEIKRSLISQIEQSYASQPIWARDQAICNASLAAMQLMLAAKAMGLDSGPIGGFDQHKLIEAFSIPERYVPIMLVTVGKAAEPARLTVRQPIEETIGWNRFE